MQTFDKLPPHVSATLDETERGALAFQAKFATIAEDAGTTFAQNLQANMGQGFDQALASANQAVADMLAPFIAEHPEMAQMFQPLFDAMNKTGPGSAQAVQEVLQTFSGMPGPVGDVARDMLSNYQTEFGDKLPGVTKGGMEQALTDLTQIMAEGMNKIVEKLNTLINTGIKQEPENVPLITADVNPANEQIQSIGKSVADLKIFLAEPAQQISIQATETNPLDAQIQLIGTSLQQVKDLLAVPLTITVDTGPAGIAITGLQEQINGVVGKNVTITVDTGPAGIAITGLQGDIDAVHGKGVAITVDTGAAGLAITGLQGDIDAVHGTNVYITVDTSGAQAAIQQLQQQINSLQQSMGGIGTGFTPGYQSPYGSYQGAYGSPYGYAKGFGPAVINRPTRMLVGEAGPEMVSVIPMKGNNQWQGAGWVTAATGMGNFSPEETATLQYRDQTVKERDQYLASQKGSQQGAQQGTQRGMQQSQGGMQQAVQQGAQQGVEQGMQQSGYPEAPSRIAAALQAGNMAEAFAGFGQNMPFTWTGGAMGQTLGMAGGGGGGAQYPEAPSRIQAALQSGNMAEAMAGFGTGYTFNWTGGKMGQTLGFATAEGFEDGLNTSRIGGQIGQAAARGLGTSITVTGGLKPGQSGGTPSGQFPGMGGGSLAGGGGGGTQAFPGVYSGQVPASYGKPLGQLINGIKATILPGQGPIRQAATGMHERLRKNTLIQAHKDERVDIGPAGPAHRDSEPMNQRDLGRITQLLERLLSQGSNFKVDFNVDGRKLSSVAAKNMGTAGYGDK